LSAHRNVLAKLAFLDSLATTVRAQAKKPANKRALRGAVLPARRWEQMLRPVDGVDSDNPIQRLLAG